MATTKSYHLSWNNHLPNIRDVLGYFYNDQRFVDVTLSCTDGMIRAHKVVLSACSPYFDSIFVQNPCEHPTVVLRGISLCEMKRILEYMYVGAMDVPEYELPATLAVAKELLIKGLVQLNNDSDSYDTQCSSSTTSSRDETCNSKIRDCPQELHELSEPKQSMDVGENEVNPSILQNDRRSENAANSNTNNNEDDKNKMNGVIDVTSEQCKSDQSYGIVGDESHFPSDQYCGICSRGFLTKQNMKRHMQIHSGIKPHQCNYCTLSFLRLSHLQRHVRVHTGERPFPCKHCDKMFSRSDKLKQHVVQHHLGVVVRKPKQRGRPRKLAFNAAVNFNSLIDKKSVANSENLLHHAPTFETLQQIYNISPNSLPGISAV